MTVCDPAPFSYLKMALNSLKDATMLLSRGVPLLNGIAHLIIIYVYKQVIQISIEVLIVYRAVWKCKFVEVIV